VQVHPATEDRRRRGALVQREASTHFRHPVHALRTQRELEIPRVTAYIASSYKCLLHLAGKAAEAIEALTLAFAIIKTTIGALSKLGYVADVMVVTDLCH